MSQRVAEALFELQQYLQDEIPPAKAGDAVAMLMAQPPDVVMQRIASWSVEQSQARSLKVSELLLFALKKIYVMGERNLLDRTAVGPHPPSDAGRQRSHRRRGRPDRQGFLADLRSPQARGRKRRQQPGASAGRAPVKPTPHEEEKDPAFVRDVWIKASSGAPVRDWEHEMQTDCYRVRRIVAHWVEQGALVAG